MIKRLWCRLGMHDPGRFRVVGFANMETDKQALILWECTRGCGAVASAFAEMVG